MSDIIFFFQKLASWLVLLLNTRYDADASSFCIYPLILHSCFIPILIFKHLTLQKNLQTFILTYREEEVHSREKRLRWVGGTINRRLPFIDYDPISKICCHDEIVLHNKGSLFRMQDKSLYHLRHHNALFRIQKCTRLVYQINICWLKI